MNRYVVNLMNDAGKTTILRVKAATNTDAQAKALAYLREHRPETAFEVTFTTRLGRR